MSRPKLQIRWLFLFLALAPLGCAHGRIPWAWKNPDYLKEVDPAHPVREPAIVRYRSDHTALYFMNEKNAGIEQQRHEVIEILTEAGLKYAEVKIPFPSDSELLLLKARTISPNGHIDPVDASKIFQNVNQSGASGGESTQYRLFRFPRAEVGSLLEYLVTTRRRTPRLFLLDEIAGELPIAQYHAEITYSPLDAEVMARSYNLIFKFLDYTERKIVRHSLDALDIPAETDEELALPYSRRGPLWMFRVNVYKEFVPGFYIQGIPVRESKWIHYDVSKSWQSALVPLTRRLYEQNQDLLGPQSGAVRFDECHDDKACILEKALAYVRDQTDFTGFADGFGDLRPTDEVLASHTANGMEKTFLLWRLLSRAGIDARFAAVSRWVPGTFDETFYTPNQFDHLILRIPNQRGIDQATWIDPACESCAVGQIPAWDVGVTACVLDGMERLKTDPQAEVTFAAVAGAAPVASLERVTYLSRLDANGTLEMEVADQDFGARAQEVRMATRGWSTDRHRQSSESFVRSRMRSGRLKDATRIQCTKATSECHRRLQITLPGYATVDGDRLLLPLTLFDSSWDHRLESPERHGDLFVGSAELSEEVAVIDLPEGYDLAAPVAFVQRQVAVADYTLDVRSDGIQLTVRRTFQDHPGRYVANIYPALRQLARAYRDTREQVLVLTRRPATVVKAAP